jgi:hypothetical protein
MTTRAIPVAAVLDKKRGQRASTRANHACGNARRCCFRLMSQPRSLVQRSPSAYADCLATPLNHQRFRPIGRNMLERIGDGPLGIVGWLFSILAPAWVWIALFAVLGLAIAEFA